ncbi:hypothetical protein F8S13_24355 [Chloroflexia bacterium SDU3-3]|nr:hypothetical protein F8S13_24355 [Chloroflexia bacterium SDU3-3]
MQVGVAILCMLAMTACDLTGGLSSSIDRAANIIDSGIHDIGVSSAVWQSVLQRVAEQLPKDISETVRVDAQSLANRSIATAGTEFRCNTDFLGSRAIQSLRALKAELLGQSQLPVPPGFCQVDPASIDLKISPEKWSTVLIAGYDLDHKDTSSAPLSIFLVDEQGQRTPLPESRIGRTTHYQITLNLGQMAAQLYSAHIRKIVVSWDGSSVGFPEIVVVPWEPQRIRQPLIDVGSTGPYTPPRVGKGDRDFDTEDDSPTSLSVRGELRITESEIESRISMHAREDEPDHTEVNGSSAWDAVYTAPTGWKIVEVRPSAASTVNTKVTSNQSDERQLTFNRPSGEVVEQFQVWVDREGDEAGSWSRLSVNWRPIEVTIEELTPAWLR